MARGDLAYIRAHYAVPAHRAARVVANGQAATIVGARGAHLRLRVDGQRHVSTWHPTWRMHYPDAGATLAPAARTPRTTAVLR